MAFSSDVPHEHGSCRAVVVLGLVEDRGNVLAHLSVILHGSHIVLVHGQQMARAGASTDEVEVKEQSRFRPLVLRESHVGDSGSARPGARDPAHRAGSVHVGGARAARRDLVRTATRRDSEHNSRVLVLQRPGRAESPSRDRGALRDRVSRGGALRIRQHGQLSPDSTGLGSGPATVPERGAGLSGVPVLYGCAGRDAGGRGRYERLVLRDSSRRRVRSYACRACRLISTTDTGWSGLAGRSCTLHCAARPRFRGLKFSPPASQGSPELKRLVEASATATGPVVRWISS